MVEQRTQQQDTALATAALISFVNSSAFCGVVSPRDFYAYCAGSKQVRFVRINANFFYNWESLSLQSLCQQHLIPFRVYSAKDTPEQSAARVAIELITLAKKSPKGKNCTASISEKSGKGKNIVSANVHRSIGMENLNYLVSIKFSVKQVPHLNREDLKAFFTTLRTEQLKDIKGYVQHVRDRLSPTLLKQA